MIIPQPVLDAMIRQAYDELPNEACGLLTGLDAKVHKHYPLNNLDHSPEHFSFDPKDQFRVLKEARADGLKIIANYHSHPSSPARPSQEDIRLAYDPDTVYIILSLAGKEPAVKAFSIRKGAVTPVEIEIEEG
ncbi:MAG: M67 family metallopeptidase [Bacteroidales bacterium]|jgi:proteasome lid subunit RPN8/RPN11|nr:M67 family metallopeptidase [Bacteroidales bacterium]